MSNVTKLSIPEYCKLRDSLPQISVEDAEAKGLPVINEYHGGDVDIPGMVTGPTTQNLPDDREVLLVYAISHDMGGWAYDLDSRGHLTTMKVARQLHPELRPE